MNTPASRHLLAITPPDDISRKVDEYRARFRGTTEFNIVPHITLRQPFYLAGITEDELGAIIDAKSRELPSGKIVCDTVDVFEKMKDNNVIFFKPNDESTNYLNTLNDALAPGSEFHPHITIASGISNEKFPAVRAALAAVNERFEFPVASVDLYRQDPPSNVWRMIRSYKLR
jgi:2'-5' RNA ligase